MRNLSRRQLRRRGRSLRVEPLEPRIVLDSHLGAAAGDATDGAPDAALGIERFESSEELRDFLVDTAVQRFKNLFGHEAPWWGHGYYPPVLYDTGVAFGDNSVPRALSGGVAELASGVLDNFDGTNVQVQGVDEGDLVKTDGEYLYVSSAGELSIIDVRNPEELALAAQLEIPHGVNQMYVGGDHLTIISTEYGFLPRPANLIAPAVVDAVLPIREFDGPDTIVTVYDISDPASPGWVSDTRLDGSLVTSRRLDDLVYVVTNQHINLPHPEVICDEQQEQETPEERLEQLLSRLPQNIDLKSLATNLDLSGLDLSGLKLSESLTNVNLGALVDEIDLAGADIPALLADLTYPFPYPYPESCVYESEEAYVARVAETIVTDVLPHYEVTQEAQVAIGGLLNAPEEIYKPIVDDVHSLSSITVINTAASTDGIVSAATVPSNYSTTVYASADNIYLTTNQWHQDTSETRIQQFSIGEEGGVELVAVGSVSGTLLNQFSLDEHNGHLRVVTTTGWGVEQTNSLYVLEASEQALEVVGSIESIAPGERIFAARFMGDQAFVVTFRVVDPLFTIDLSDPTAPVIQGELKIPGFSNYLHPVDEGFLLGLGRGDGGFGATPQVSLFDATDPHDPTRIAVFDLDKRGISSTALWDHHAVGFFDEDNILAIPVSYTVERDVPKPWPDDSAGICMIGVPSPCNGEEWWGDELIEGVGSIVDAAIGEVFEPAILRDYVPTRYQRVNELWVFQIAPDLGEEAISLLGQIEHERSMLRSVRIGDVLFAISTDTVTSHPLLTPMETIDELYFGRIAINDHFTIDVADEHNVLDVLHNDRDADNSIIVAVETTPGGGTVDLPDDGKTLVYTPPTDGLAKTDRFTYTIDNGVCQDTAHVRITLKAASARDRMIRLAKEDLAERLPIGEDEIELASVVRRTWPDSCLGVDPGDGGCADVVTPGFHIRFETAGGIVGYHTDLVDRVVIAHSALRLHSDHFDVEGQTGPVTLDVLKNDGAFAEYLTIIEVSESEGTVTIADDGKSLLYEVTSDSPSDRDFFSYTVQLSEGITNTARVSVVVKKETFDDLAQAAVEALARELDAPADSIHVVAIEETPRFFWCPDDVLHECHFRVKIALQHEDRFYIYYAREHYVQRIRIVELQARDDTAEVRAGSDGVEIPVLRNDTLSLGSFHSVDIGPRFITAVSDSSAGAVITFGERSIRYTPPNGFVGEDVFTYSVGDLTAEVRVNVTGFAGDEAVMSIRPQIVNAAGEVVTMLRAGDEAVLQILTDDLRDEPRQVFAAYTDVEFDASLVAELGVIGHGEVFTDVPSGNTETPGLIDELGGVNFDYEIDRSGEQLLASVAFVAGQAGALTFTTSAPDLLPEHLNLLLGADDGVPATRVEFGSATVEITDDMHNEQMPEDTNADGEASAIDALLVINYLNDIGPKPVSEIAALRADGAGSGALSFLDVNGDGFVSPIDALLVINRILAHVGGTAEGEAPAEESTQLVVDQHAQASPVTVDAAASRTPRDRSRSTTNQVSIVSVESAQAADPAWTRVAKTLPTRSREWSRSTDEAFADLNDVQSEDAWWSTL